MSSSARKQKDVTSHLFRYVDAKRHLWNTYFHDEGMDLRKCGPLDDFETIDRALFDSLVLRAAGKIPLGSGHVFGVTPVREVRLQTRDESAPVGVLISGAPPKREGVWRAAELDVTAPYTLEFIEFFDWDRYAKASYPLVLARIAASKANPEYADHNCLIDAHRIRAIG